MKYFLPSYKVKLEIGTYLMMMSRAICRITDIYQKEINKPNDYGEDNFQTVWMFRYVNVDTGEENEMEGWVVQLQNRLRPFKCYWHYLIVKKIGDFKQWRTLRWLHRMKTAKK